MTNEIKCYLDNEDSAYLEWYRKKLFSELGQSDSILTGETPSIDRIKENFKNWFEDKKELLKNKICFEWNYVEKRFLYNDDLKFIEELAKYIGNFIDFPLEVASILFLGGLDSLCLN